VRSPPRRGSGGAHTIGVIPQSMVEREWADHASDELLVVESMRERKAQMEARADAFLALPGGLGTCEELFEIWTSGLPAAARPSRWCCSTRRALAGLLAWVRDLAGQRLRRCGTRCGGSSSPPTCPPPWTPAPAPVPT
jgi:uncharacterized protein (TIGR00730 family)